MNRTSKLLSIFNFPTYEAALEVAEQECLTLIIEKQ
jgi:hypothetical protein